MNPAPKQPKQEGMGVAETWTIQRIISWTSDFFAKKNLDSPRLTAELLLAHALGCDRVRLYLDFDRPLNKDELANYRSLVERRAAREPTFYILGYREFFGRRFQVDSRVLVPRPETEHLIEAALEKLPVDGAGPVLDLCTGSGCIGLTLASERPQLQVVATDLSSSALMLAQDNARALGVAERVELLNGNLFQPVAGRAFSMIVSNPPYVASGAIGGLMEEVQREPREALDGGDDGLVIIRQIISQAAKALQPNGWLILEIGEDQGAKVQQLFVEAGLVDGSIRLDLAQLERLALARRP